MKDRKNDFSYWVNLEAERMILVHKFWHSDKSRDRVKVRGSKAAHLRKLYLYASRAR